MRGTVAKMLRRAAGMRGVATQYEQPQIHHLVEVPAFETHTRTVREYDPKAKRIIGREVRCIRYRADGKTPLQPMVSWQMGKSGELVIKPVTSLAPVAKPYRLLMGSPRRVLKVLKRLYRAGKMDEMFKQIQSETQSANPAPIQA